MTSRLPLLIALVTHSLTVIAPTIVNIERKTDNKVQQFMGFLYVYNIPFIKMKKKNKATSFRSQKEDNCLEMGLMISF